ncbi:MAG TPA: tyrosine-type recombinase/integrase [Candidatus Dormibacteraeota bacterium]|nr:tyrosine-type recombinase/integrase [Candidatus Dormibacteraeota bacterium]
MSDLARHADDYLTLRRALGFKLVNTGRFLPQLVSYLEAAGAKTLTVDLAIAWARQLPRGKRAISMAHRLGAARGFARYLRAIDPETEVPPRGIWTSDTRRPVPYLYSDDDMRRLLEATQQLRPRLRAATHEALFGLLAASGMRIGEARRLERDDVDLADGVLTIRESKFDRSRLVPLHPSAVDALRAYAAERDRLCPRPKTAAFFVSSVGTALGYSGVLKTFNELTAAIGLRSATVRPRIHDLRHSFAVRTIIELHRSGADVGAHVAVLSTYLGHVNPAGTYWYLSAAPELMELAAARLDGRFGGRS